MAFPFDQGPVPLPPDFLAQLRAALLANARNPLAGRTDTGPMMTLPVMGPGGATSFTPGVGWIGGAEPRTSYPAPGPRPMPVPGFPTDPFEPRTTYPMPVRRTQGLATGDTYGGDEYAHAGWGTAPPMQQPPLPRDYGSRRPYAGTPGMGFTLAVGQRAVPSNPGLGWQLRNVLGVARDLPDYTNPKTPWNRVQPRRPSFQFPYRVGGRY